MFKYNALSLSPTAPITSESPTPFAHSFRPTPEWSLRLLTEVNDTARKGLAAKTPRTITITSHALQFTTSTQFPRQTSEFTMEAGESTAAPAEAAPDQRRHKNKFTSQEDRDLLALVEQHGTKQWDRIADSLPGRSARQCRDRWKNYLAPNVNQMPWTREEDQRLLQLYQLVGPRWSKIGATFPGRTSVSVKNRWHKLHRIQMKLVCSGQIAAPAEFQKPPGEPQPPDEASAQARK